MQLERNRYFRLEFGRIFTRPSDQPRHALNLSEVPVETRAPPQMSSLDYSMKSFNMSFMKLISFIALLMGILPSIAHALELNSTVMFFNQDDLDKCEWQINKAHKLTNSKIHFVSSIYVDLDGKKVEQYYLKNKQAEPEKVNQGNLEKYQRTLLRCVDLGLNQFSEVYVTVVINQIKEDRVWRNFYKYDPLAKYTDYSLFDITFEPFAKLSKKKASKVYLALTGEMGRTVKMYPESYSKIIKMLPRELNIGISINHNQSFGGFFNWGLKLPVLNEFDFIGFSAYAMTPSNCKVQDFKDNMKLFRKRIRRYGLTKPEKQWRIHITETGIGGGQSLAAMISKLPFKGVYGRYDKKKDPWRHANYRKIRKNFYKCLLDSLQDTKLVQAAFIWNADSLDIQGLYPFSKNYRNEEIATWIKNHNLKYAQ